MTYTEDSAANGKDKAGKFCNLAEKRVTKTVLAIRQIANLSARGNYDYTPEQVERIFAAIRAEIDAAEKRFAPKNGGGRGEYQFTLE